MYNVQCTVLYDNVFYSCLQNVRAATPPEVREISSAVYCVIGEKPQPTSVRKSSLSTPAPENKAVNKVKMTTIRH